MLQSLNMFISCSVFFFLTTRDGTLIESQPLGCFGVIYVSWNKTRDFLPISLQVWREMSSYVTVDWTVVMESESEGHQLPLQQFKAIAREAIREDLDEAGRFQSF